MSWSDWGEMTDETPPDEPKLFDLNRWIALEDERKQGMGILVPSTNDEMDIRRSLITKVSGAPPNAYRAVKAAFHIEALMSQIENRKMRADPFRAVENVLELMMSASMWNADAVKEMAQMSPKPPVKRSIVDAFFGQK